MDAVFASVPVASGAMAALSVKVAVPLTSRSTLAPIEPEPDAGQEDPAEAEQVQVTPESDAGGVSETVAAVTAEGPPLPATIV
jgi:hypothetical protein